MNLEQKTRDFVRQQFDQSDFLRADPRQQSYRWQHTLRVAAIGRQIAQAEGLDEQALVVACLLHDVSYREDLSALPGGWKEHGRRAAAIAREFLADSGLPAAAREEICYGIAIHVDDRADFAGEATVLARSVSDCDNIDRFGPWRIHETLVWRDFLAMNPEEQLAFVRRQVQGLEGLQVDFATRTAGRMFCEQLQFQLEYYRRLARQLESAAW